MAITLTPEQNEYLGFMGQLVRNNTVELAALLMLYGAFLILFIGATRILIWRSNESKMAPALLLLSLLLLVSTTTRVASFFTFVMTQMKGYWIASDLTLEERRALVRGQVYPLDRLQEFTRAFNVMLSDFIVVWRAWVLFRPERVPRAALAVLMFINACGLLTAPIMVSVSHDTIDFDLKKVYCASMFFSSATNLTATFLIGYKAWTHNRISRRLLDRSRPDIVGKVFLLLIESGVAFAVVQIIDAILNQAVSFDEPSTGTMTTYIFDEIVIVLAGIYPLLVLFAVRSSQKSSLSHSFHTNRADSNVANVIPGQSIQFSVLKHVQTTVSRDMMNGTQHSVVDTRNEPDSDLEAAKVELK